ncbi:Uma2 family endonuclease [Desulfovirgula thermocuniculi]|uniref:Uma2 family endonuclease n=1 Tax=Desulfovirgula thermocuniculi TaxID=348842 RepID=UPI00041B3895|nr:Uma2 family endonuclease [Desulfovirgula thermocuniculi]
MPETAATREPPARRRLTYAGYLKIDDGNRYELFEGELALTPSPGLLHRCLVGNIAALLRAHVEKNDLGIVLFAPFDVVPAEDVVLQPDVFFLSRERFSLLTGDCLKGTPDLVVEVLSPSPGRRDRLQKSQLYLRYGRRNSGWWTPLWKRERSFAPAKRAGCWAGIYGPEDSLASPLLPDFTPKVADFFHVPSGDAPAGLSPADCAFFATARRLGIKTVFTFDRHFAEQGFTCLPEASW